MNIEEVKKDIREGNVPLRPIIDYYAETGRESELAELLDDREICTSALYIISELPSVDHNTWLAVSALLERGLTGEASLFAKDIVESSNIRSLPEENAR